MKKIKSLLLIVAIVLVLGVITSCDGNNPATGNVETPTVEHTHDYKSVVVNPTCEKGGYTKHTCECGDTYNDAETSALGHTEVIDAAVQPSCINDGIGLSEGKHCSVCNKVLVAQETVKGDVEHIFGEWTVIKEATEDEEGSKKQVCTICGLENVQSIPLKEHVHSYTSKVVEPTCDMPGYTMHECTKCGECYTDNEVEPLGHDWLEATYIWSDDSSMVTAVRLCKNDNTHNETLTVEVTSEVVQEQTCTLPELTTYTASFEGTSFETQMKEVVTQEALGHLWWQEIMYTWNECDGGWEATATRVCGRNMSHNEVEVVKATGVVVQEQTCTLPELTTYTATFEGTLFETQAKENVKTKEASGHNYASEVINPTCETNGYTKYTCKCGDEYTDDYTNQLTHDLGEEIPEVPATCLTDGKEAYYICGFCGKFIQLDEEGYTIVLEEHLIISALGHTEVINEAVEATCNSAGLTQGSYCFVCGEVLVEQEIIPALGHTEVIDEAVGATCETSGLTEGSHCGECGEVIVAQEIVSALGHTEEIDEAVEATCETAGLTQGSHCSMCGETLVKQIIIEAGHTEEIDEAVEATCETTGLTQGSYCFVCGEVIVAQEEIPALGHTEEIDEAVEATCETTGLTQGSHCDVCGEVIVAQEEIPALGHTEEIDEAVEATCETTGLTQGSHCDVCGEVIVAQEIIVASGHALQDGNCNNCDYTVAIYELNDDNLSYKVIGYNENIESIEIFSEYNGLPVTVIDDRAFYNCSNLLNISIPTSVISIGESVFSGCSNLEYYEYNNCYYLGNDNNPYVVLFKVKDTSITQCEINENTKCVYMGAFSGCSRIMITIPSSVVNIGKNSLPSNTLILYIYYNGTMEDWCKISFGYNDSNSDAFHIDCLYMLDENGEYYEVTEIIIPDTITTIGNNQFSGLSKVTSITIPNSVTSIEDYAFYCKKVTDITLGKNVTNIGYGAFDCSSLENVYYNGTMEDWCNITFTGYAWTNPMYYASHFYMLDENNEYYEVTEIIIPDTITTIGISQFSGFNSVTSIILSSSVINIADSAFEDCSGLENVYYTGTEEEWNNITIGSSNNYLTSATITYNYTEIK